MTAAWTPDTILNACRAYQPAAVIIAAAELELFDTIKNKSLTAADIAKILNADPRALTILLDALTAMNLLKKTQQQYQLSPPARQYLTADSPDSLLPAIHHTGNCMRRWARLAHVVKTGQPASTPPGIRGEQADRDAFINAMHVFSDPRANAVVARLKPLAFTHLLDIGGASGTWTIEFLKAVPQASAALFDLPDVIPLAEERFKSENLSSRVTLVAGDFYADPLPRGADFAWLSAIAHQNSQTQNRDLFKKIFNALNTPGTLVMRDVVMDPSHTQPLSGAMFAVNMLVATDGGSAYAFDQYRDDLIAAGFTDIEQVYQDEHMDSLIRAKKK